MNIARVSAADLLALELAVAAIGGDWSPLDELVGPILTRGRVNRLVTLGLLERRPDVVGWLVRVTPTKKPPTSR